MKAACVQSNKIMTILCFVVILFGFMKILPTHVILGFAIGYVTSRFIIKKFVGQLDHLESGQLPSSNFLFNMLVYASLFAVMSYFSMSALLSAFIGLIAYRKLFFIFAEKNMKKGGFDGNND